MILTDDERRMLNGEEGEDVQKAMELLVKYGEALGAEKFIDVNNVGGYLIVRPKDFKEHDCSYDSYYSTDALDSDEVVHIKKVKVPSYQYETSLDPDYYQLAGHSKEVVDIYNDNIEHLSDMGVNVICTCTPYQVGNVPVKGEHCAWMESSAVVYINSVLGARTNCEGSESSTASMLTGKTPYWGLHLTENRYATHQINVNVQPETMEDWGILGYYVGKTVNDKIPVLTGIKTQPNRDMLKHFGAAAASSGGVELYHIPGLTAEANTLEEALGGKEPECVFEYNEEDKKEAYDLLNSIGENRNVDFIMLGCPHYSLEQIWDLCNLIQKKNAKVKEGVNFWVFTAPALKEQATRNGFTKIIEDFGGLLMRDCCPALGRFKPENSKVLATDSAKQAHYLPNITGIESWYGSLEECVDAAISGIWKE